MEQIELPFHPCHLGVPCPWYIWCKPCIYLASRLTVSPNGPKRASISPTSPSSCIGCAQKWLQCPWYIRRKPCTYLVSRLTLSPNRLKCVSTWSTSCRSTIGCTQNDFQAYGTFNANEFPFDPCHAGVQSGVPKAISEPMVHSAQTVHLSCVEISSISKRTKMSFHLTNVT
jgi:hypothetical protein